MKLLIKTLAALTLIGALTVPHLAGAAPSHALSTLFVTVNGKKISVSGAATGGAVRVHLTVVNEPFGNATLVRLNPGVTVQMALSQAGNDLNAISQFGAIRASVAGIRSANNNTVAWLPAGNYVGLDTSGEGNSNGPPPFTTFTVAPTATPAALPPAAAKYNIIDFGFRGPATLRNGQVLRIYNRGWLVHMFVGQATRQRTYQGAVEIKSLLLAGKDSQAQKIAPVFAPFSIGPISHGATEQVVVHTAPGYYVFGCFMDTQDHREHAQLGMLRIIRVLP